MQLIEIRNRVRGLLDDTAGTDSSRYWKDADLNEYINACIEEMCERTLCLDDSLTDAVCLVTLEAGKRHYALHESILAIHTAQPSWCSAPLTGASATELPAGWLQAVGLPLSYTTDYSNGMLSLASAPAAVTGETIRLSVTRLPLVDLALSTSVPEIHRQYHRKLYDGVLSMAFLKQDAEVYNPSKSKGHRDKWEEILNTTVRRESRLKPRVLYGRSMEMA